MKYAIQGIEGSFHQVALHTFLGKSVETDRLVACDSFRKLIQEVEKSTDKKRIQGIMAIENSTIGSLLTNYNLLQQSNLRIVGEVYIQIALHLMANKNVKKTDIAEVHSHPIALQQCANYLSQYKWRTVEMEDTALSARRIRDKKSKNVACIASELSASLYGLNILESSVNDYKKNYTRFLMLDHKKFEANIEDADKASIQFSLPEEKGSLARALSKISEEGINLSKLQSFAKPGTHFEHYFHADLEFDDIKRFNNAIKKITPLSENIAIYGIYKNGLRQ